MYALSLTEFYYRPQYTHLFSKTVKKKTPIKSVAKHLQIYSHIKKCKLSACISAASAQARAGKSSIAVIQLLVRNYVYIRNKSNWY